MNFDGLLKENIFKKVRQNNSARLLAPAAAPGEIPIDVYRRIFSRMLANPAERGRRFYRARIFDRFVDSPIGPGLAMAGSQVLPYSRGNLDGAVVGKDFVWGFYLLLQPAGVMYLRPRLINLQGYFDRAYAVCPDKLASKALLHLSKGAGLIAMSQSGYLNVVCRAKPVYKELSVQRVMGLFTEREKVQLARMLDLGFSKARYKKLSYYDQQQTLLCEFAELSSGQLMDVLRRTLLARGLSQHFPGPKELAIVPRELRWLYYMQQTLKPRRRQVLQRVLGK